jgi:single-strand DNA-binding protein
MNTMTITGNLTDTPELRYTASGQAVTHFRVASTPRIIDKATGEWKDGETLFMNCDVWRQQAEHVAESLKRGQRVIVTGKIRQRSYETSGGEKRTVFELDVEEIGISLKFDSFIVQEEPVAAGAPF